jgi:CxxC motif-containing protein
MELICIVCPRSCRLTVTDGVVSGNACKRGEAFAVTETTCPTRVVCSTVATSFKNMPVLPVRTAGEIPKAKIGELMKFIDTLFITEPTRRGDVLAENVVGTEINLIATATLVES